MALPVQKLAFIIEKAREIDAMVEDDDPDTGSNPADDMEVAISSKVVVGCFGSLIT
ncbi:MAG: hypothetical protein HOP13_08455 [Alphaproteobacteria bacterium]|nr:hypothetical protein [Alphaproteobacteria bacterium]